MPGPRQAVAMPVAGLLFRPGRPDAGPGAELLDAFVGEIEGLYEPGFVGRSPSATPRDFAPPGGAFLVGYLASEPVACGGIKRLESGVCEVKRMYVAPVARSRGVARRLLEALEAAARELGYARARLDTGPRQPSARALYESAGYRAIADYNANPYAAFWGEKAL